MFRCGAQLLVLAMVLGLGSSAFATDFFVDDQLPFDPLATPGSLNNPFSNVQEALDADTGVGADPPKIVQDGDTIRVAPGEYPGFNMFFEPADGVRDVSIVFDPNAAWPVTQVGTEAVFRQPSYTVPAPGTRNTNPPVSFGIKICGHNTSATIIDGLTIRDWHTKFGALFISQQASVGSSPTIQNCVFEDLDRNQVEGTISNSTGAAISITNRCNPAIENCTFENNQSGWSGGPPDCVFVLDQYGGAIGIASNDITINSPGSGISPSIYPNVTITGCTFFNNEAFCRGGAIGMAEANAVITDCLFSENDAWSSGGAIFCKLTNNLVVEDCTFVGNSVLGTITPPTTQDCEDLNMGVTIGDREGGGAILAAATVDDKAPGRVRIINNAFSLNTAGMGSAIALGNVNATVSHNTFAGNTTVASTTLDTPGGVLTIVADDTLGDINALVGFTVRAIADVDMSVLVVNNLFAENNFLGAPTSPGVVWVVTGDEDLHELECSVTMVNNTSADNGVSTVSLEETTGAIVTMDIQNSILWDATPTVDETGLPTVTLVYCDVIDTSMIIGPTNIFADPLFQTTNYQLTSASPCIDAGFNAHFSNARMVDSQIPNTDRKGQKRFVPGPGGSTKIIDMGCYEYQTP